MLEILYRSLSDSLRAITDTISEGALMHCWDAAQELLDDIAVTNRGWITRDFNHSSSTYAIGETNIYGANIDMVAQEVE